ncbi:ATPase domain-containing protein [Pyrodictium abyssi]|uniref:KaiC domain-containing protein n=1 Tax=Pyrodictium abyssi TaxID=54256 RepID=A0ABM8IXU1_9CREN|nr:hypothetical protein PABY_05090 [Pyrodictium abyssi]
MNLVEWGIEGLDKLLGGVPRGAVVLLAGNPGTGKSTFAAKFLYEGARRLGEPGVYLNFVEPRQDFLSHMAMLGMDFESLEEKGLFHYVEALTIVDEEALVAQLEELESLVRETGAKRLVVDSITVIMQLVNGVSKARELLQNFFVNGLKPLGVTSILIAEHPYGARMVGYGIEEFIVDAVVLLRFESHAGKMRRVLELRKARWAPIYQVELPFEILPGRVVDIAVPEEPKSVPAPVGERVYSFADIARAARRPGRQPLVRTLLPSGSPLPVEVASSVYFSQGSQVLVHVSESIHTRFLVALLAATLHVYTGEKVAVFSFKSAPSLLERMTRCVYSIMSGAAGPGDGIVFDAVNPSAYLPEHIVSQLRGLVESEKPSLLFLEGIEGLEELYGAALHSMMVNVPYMLRRLGVTTLYFYASDAAPQEKRMLRLLRIAADMKIDVYPQALETKLDQRGRKRLVQKYRMWVKTPTVRLEIVKEFDMQPLMERRCVY